MADANLRFTCRQTDERFKVQKYKCILDSDWVRVSDLTVLVGKNESGKTSLLKALHKFNPFKPEPYVIDREWPRGHRSSRDPKAIVCVVSFSLDEDEWSELSRLTEVPDLDLSFVIQKTY